MKTLSLPILKGGYPMKGISYITDENNKRKAVVIDLRTFKKHEEEIEDLLDVLMRNLEKMSLLFHLGKWLSR